MSKLPHSPPRSRGEIQNNLGYLSKLEYVHRLQRNHHEELSRRHHAQATLLEKIATTHPVGDLAKTEYRLAEHHAKMIDKHSVKLQKIKAVHRRQTGLLSDRQAMKPRGKGKNKRHRRSVAFNLGYNNSRPLGDSVRTQLTTLDRNRNAPIIRPGGVADSVQINELRKRLGKRLPRQLNQMFQLGTMSNHAPDNGLSSVPNYQFGAPYSV